MLVLLKQVKFDLGAKIDVDAFGCRFIDRLLQDEPAVFFKLCAVWIHDIAVHAHDPSVHRPPGQDYQGGRVRFQKQIAFGGIAESGDRGSVERDAFAESAFQLLRQDRDVFLDAEDIEECQTDKFDIFFLDERFHIFIRIMHNGSFPCKK